MGRQGSCTHRPCHRGYRRHQSGRPVAHLLAPIAEVWGSVKHTPCRLVMSQFGSTAIEVSLICIMKDHFVPYIPASSLFANRP